MSGSRACSLFGHCNTEFGRAVGVCAGFETVVPCRAGTRLLLGRGAAGYRLCGMGSGSHRQCDAIVGSGFSGSSCIISSTYL